MQSSAETNSIDGLVKEALRSYTSIPSPEIYQTYSGMNNTTRLIVSNGKKYNLRIYNNHRDHLKLHNEHLMLASLLNTELSIEIPVPIVNDCLSTITELANGKLVALFSYIEGELPSIHNWKHVQGLGKATGLLSKALSQIDLSIQPAYTPYYDLSTNYQPFTNEMIGRLVADSPLLLSLEQHLCKIQKVREVLELRCEQYKFLPQHWIHGDINLSNSVAKNDEIVGILDFEFVTKDLRAMELAVTMAEIIKPNITAMQIDQYLQDIFQAYIHEYPLFPEEYHALKDLIRLRIIDVVMHFVERYDNKLDKEHILYEIVEYAIFALQYLEHYSVVPKT